ncbi:MULTISPECIES: colicin E3/pyocin S6 family cytotoxin [Rhizobium]|uniref:colicin E3/pyocin S6 family cytotoxin n=1 Tax=Rhizobium TaxID=379 RepID=UPI0018D51196|nr:MULTISPECIES: colicin E3/pyocin S6 family cytotoxin [Rhizobium]
MEEVIILAAERGGTATRETFMKLDYQHCKLEKFDKSGKKHVGEYDPVTGAQTKPPKPGPTTPKG